MDWVKEKERFASILLLMAQEKEKELKALTKEAQERANEAEGAMQSRYDTFKEEGQYLAGGLKLRYDEARSDVATIKALLEAKEFEKTDAVRLYSVVIVEFDDGEESRFFVFPVMGGQKIEETHMVISPHSPVGKALIGKEEGDSFEFTTNNRIRRGEVTFVI